MKVVMRSLLAFLLLFTQVNNILANNESPETVVIEEEQTPEAGRKRNQVKYTFMAFISVACVLGGILLYKQDNASKAGVSLDINSIAANGDGSYLVKIGYNNHSKHSIPLKNKRVNVNSGCAIVVKDLNEKELKPGIQKDAFITIVNEDTDLSIQIDDYTAHFKGKDIKERNLKS